MTNFATTPGENQPARLTVVTNLQESIGEGALPFSKRIWRDESGVLHKQVMANIVRARAETLEIVSLEALRDVLSALQSSQALVHGIAEASPVTILPHNQLPQENCISRTLKFFQWPAGRGIMPFDYDPEEGKLPLPADEIIKTLRRVCPELADVRFLSTPSVSAYIYDAIIGEELSGPGGVRFYAMIDDASQMLRVASSIAIRLWRAGLGYIKWSKDGRPLPRTLIDMVIYSPERPNFAGPASLAADVEQRKPPAIISGGSELVAASVPDHGEYLDFLHKALEVRELLTPHASEQQARQLEYAAKRASEGGNGAAWLRASEGGILPRDTVILFSAGENTLATAVEANPAQFNGLYCADPLEPEEGRSRAVIRARKDGSFTLHTFLHGGRDYRIETPLENLVARCAVDAEGPAAAFADESLAALARLPDAEYQAIRFQLKNIAGHPVNVAALDKAVMERKRRGDDGEGKSDETIVACLIRLASVAQFAADDRDELYADININGHRETHLVRSSGFRRWLRSLYFAERGGAPKDEDLKSALATLDAKARFGELALPRVRVFKRVARSEAAIYIDLCDDEWRVLEVTSAGWGIATCTPGNIRFTRRPAMLPLMPPQQGGDINALRKLVNVGSDADFVLVVAWLLGALSGEGPYAVAVVQGEAGSAKSSLLRRMRALIDPNAADIRRPPKSSQSLFISAQTSHILAFDNLSKLDGETSDDFAVISTGGAISNRTLYTDDEETILRAKNPLLLNGIEDFVFRGDLVDRSILLHLRALQEAERLTEAQLDRRFHALAPGILGALLDACSTALSLQGIVTLPPLPRMAEFASWVIHCEYALWPEGTFLRAFNANRSKAQDALLDSDEVAKAVRDFMRTLMRARIVEDAALGLPPCKSIEWGGNLQGLLNALGTPWNAPQWWPKSPRALTSALRRCAPLVRSVASIDIRTDVDRRRAAIGGGQNDVVMLYTPSQEVRETLEIEATAGEKIALLG